MNNTIGNYLSVTFVDTNKTIKGKVDTGASTSCLHGENIKINGNRVSFVCPDLSPNVITVDMNGSQQVKTADGGVDTRPTICLNIRINGIDLPDTTFNLNDRGHMDCSLLIGQNILKAGNFVIDVNKDSSGVNENIEMDIQMPDELQSNEEQPEKNNDEQEKQIKDAIETLMRYNVSLADMLRLMSE